MLADAAGSDTGAPGGTAKTETGGPAAAHEHRSGPRLTQSVESSSDVFVECAGWSFQCVVQVDAEEAERAGHEGFGNGRNGPGRLLC